MTLEISAAQLAANQKNARKSTGPKTEAGKQASSLNALRHGLTAQVVVLPTDDLAAYHRFTQNFHDDLQPKGALETQLTQSLADDAWRLNRSKALENNLFALGITEKADGIVTANAEVQNALAMAESLREQTRALSCLSMHQQRVAHQFERNLVQLRQLQTERRAREENQLRLAAQIYEMHCANAEADAEEAAEHAASGAPNDPNAPLTPAGPYQPAGDGFVFTIDEIETYIGRRDRLHEALIYNLRGQYAA